MMLVNGGDIMFATTLSKEEIEQLNKIVESGEFVTFSFTTPEVVNMINIK